MEKSPLSPWKKKKKKPKPNSWSQTPSILHFFQHLYKFRPLLLLRRKKEL